MNKILLVGKDRKYFFAEKDKENATLMPTKKYVCATDIVPYGFEFTFGKYGPRKIGFMISGPFSLENAGLSDEEVAQKNLDSTIKGLEKMVEEAKADYVLIDDVVSNENSTSGIGQLLIKR